MKVTKAAELDKMATAEGQAHLEASIITDLGQVPDLFLGKIRTRRQARIEATDTGE